MPVSLITMSLSLITVLVSLITVCQSLITVCVINNCVCVIDNCVIDNCPEVVPISVFSQQLPPSPLPQGAMTANSLTLRPSSVASCCAPVSSPLPTSA